MKYFNLKKKLKLLVASSAVLVPLVVISCEEQKQIKKDDNNENESLKSKTKLAVNSVDSEKNKDNKVIDKSIDVEENNKDITPVEENNTTTETDGTVNNEPVNTPNEDENAELTGKEALNNTVPVEFRNIIKFKDENSYNKFKERYSYRQQRAKQGSKTPIIIYRYSNGIVGIYGGGTGENNDIFSLNDNFDYSLIFSSIKNNQVGLEFDFDENLGKIEIKIKFIKDKSPKLIETILISEQGIKYETKLAHDVSVEDLSEVSNNENTETTDENDTETNSEETDNSNSANKSTETIANDNANLNLVKLNQPINEFIPDKTIFVRPIFGAQFIEKTTNQKIITLFNHADSPGGKSNREPVAKLPSNLEKIVGSQLNNQGAQEVSEFVELANVINDLSKLNPSSFVIYGGDTNIMSQNFDLQKVLLNQEINAYANTNDDTLKTSLGTKNPYVNPYDKIYFKSSKEPSLLELTTLEVDKYKYYRGDIISDFAKIFPNKQAEFYNKNGYVVNDNQTDLNLIRTHISDHLPVSMTLTKNNEPILKVAHWNILNYGRKGSQNDYLLEFKAYALAKIIAHYNYDIIGLTEINDETGDDVALIVKNLNKLTNSNKFKFIVQNYNTTKIPKSYSNRFTISQQEQVGIIYDSSKVDLDINFRDKDHPNGGITIQRYFDYLK
ncbi:hypothetical protein ACJA23_01830 [Mycoplasma corogypsi]|uniref:hypothetical protein n=1 Tax=Mycoplasma corogypsi TaxID=2106 RepID=UPI003872C74E